MCPFPNSMGAKTVPFPPLCLLVGVLLALAAAQKDIATPQDEGAVLMSFKNAITNWDAPEHADWTGWDYPTSQPCGPPAWTGIECRNGSVVAIEMYGATLSGSLAPELAQLQALEVLELQTNDFSGSAPAEWYQDSGAFPALEAMHIGDNAGLELDTAGLLGRSADSLPKLRKLWINGLVCNTRLPPTITITTLDELLVGGCGLTGTLPPALFSLLDADFPLMVDFSKGLHTGTLPAQWAQLGKAPASFTHLSVKSNRLSGSLPDAWSNFTKLEELYLDFNDLTGVLPASWPDGMNSLQKVTLNNNNLAGTIDAWMRPWQPGSMVQDNWDSGVFLRPGNAGVCGAIKPRSAKYGSSYPTIAFVDFLSNTFPGEAQLSTTAGSCGAACPDNTTVTARNAAQAAFLSSTLLSDVLALNTDPALLANGGKFLVPCYPTNEPQPLYIGGDVSFGKWGAGYITLMQRRAYPYGPLVVPAEQQIAAQVALRPAGQPFVGEPYQSPPTTEGEDSVAGAWWADLQYPLDISMVIVYAHEAMTNISVRLMTMTDDPSTQLDLFTNSIPCAEGLNFAASSTTAVACAGTGRFIFLVGNLSLWSVQVFPTYSNALLGRPLQVTGGATIAPSATKCQNVGATAGGGKAQLVADLGFQAVISAVSLLVNDTGASIQLAVSNSSSGSEAAACGLPLTLTLTPTAAGVAVCNAVGRYIVAASSAAFSACELKAYAGSAPVNGTIDAELYDQKTADAGADGGGAGAGGGSKVWIAGAVIGGLAAVALVLGLAVFARRRRQAKSSSGSGGSSGTCAVPPELPPALWTDTMLDRGDIVFDTDPLTGQPVMLGHGRQAKVLRAKLHGIAPVAVRVLGMVDAQQASLSEAAAADRQRLLRELTILRSVRCQQVVSFRGACIDKDAGQLLVVCELMEGGDLHHALYSSSSVGPEGGRSTTSSAAQGARWGGRGKRIALDVASGLAYLQTQAIVHLDLKPANILLDASQRHAKIGDVGESAILQCGNSYLSSKHEAGGGTLVYAAPEHLLGQKCGTAADIYSFGVVLWELVTGNVPVRGELRDVRVPEECSQRIADLITACLSHQAKQRPTAVEIVNILEAEVGTGGSWTTSSQ